ncbi:MAG: GAF domain-containing protein [Deltaproteobacteria bacterium]|nr:GAF domain-containing protein [Deltaproteobacteria bacterium]
MEEDKGLLQALSEINHVSQDKKKSFSEKLQKILEEIVRCMRAKSGSIMLVKGRKQLEVTASTNAALVGLKYSIEKHSPSAWVVQNRAPLRVDDISHSGIFEKRFDHYSGSSFLLAPLEGEGKVIGVLSVTDKIGPDTFSGEEQKALIGIAGQVIGTLDNQRLTESLKKKKEALQKKNLELKKLEKLKTELFNMLIHDMKGPLSETVANLDILSYTLKDEEDLEFVKGAQEGCDTLFRMVSNLLDIARMEEHKLELVYENLNPSDLVRESVARMDAMSKSKGIQILEDFSLPSGDESFHGDRDILLRVLQNLLSNAIQYSPSSENITVGCRRLEPSKIEFSVRDSGPGIPLQHHDAIFDKFKQLQKKADGRIYTTGLGLAFCKMAVEAHQGKIKVDSDGVNGSCFTFALPVNRKAR